MSNTVEYEGYKIRTDCRYTETHEWIRVEGDTVLIGVCDYAQKMLKEIAYVEVPDEGASFDAKESCAFLESLKATSDVYAPVKLEVISVNEELDEKPELINEAPYEGGYVAKVKIANPADLDGLLDVEAYKAQLKKDLEEGH